MKNAYAHKIKAAKSAEREYLIKDAVARTTNFLQDIFIVALNQEGMGKVRINRVSGYVNELVQEYRTMQESDQDYADAKLQEAVKRIMEG